MRRALLIVLGMALVFAVWAATATAAPEQSAAQNDAAATTGMWTPGPAGDLTQANDASATSDAANLNGTGQDIDQSQGGGTQVAGQSNDSDQSAYADAAAVQEKPSNTAVGIRVLSPGHDGDVSQSNSADADALAAALERAG